MHSLYSVHLLALIGYNYMVCGSHQFVKSGFLKSKVRYIKLGSYGLPLFCQVSLELYRILKLLHYK
jgi:hypothetical protein